MERTLAVTIDGIYYPVMRPLYQILTNLCLFFCLATVAVAAQAEEKKVLIHFEDYPPYEYLENGEVKGVNVELMREAFRRMDVTPTFEPMPWKRAVYELKNGGILALASGFKTPDREVFAFFPSEPLAMENVVVVAPAVSGVEVNSLEDLRGLTVGVVREYAYGHVFDTMNDLNKVEAASNPQLLKMLLSHRMDVVIMNKAVARAAAQKIHALPHIRFVYAVNSEPLYLLFSRAREFEAVEMARDFGKALKEMRKDGTYADIESRY